MSVSLISSWVILNIMIIIYNLTKNQSKHWLERILEMNLCLVYISLALELLFTGISINIAAATNVVKVKGLIVPDDVDDTDFFGSSIATNGNFTIIGSPWDDSRSGSAYIYDYNSMEFTKITANDGASGDNFGQSVAILDNFAVVGAYLDDSWSGSAYIFQYSTETATWNQMAKLTASDAASYDLFGASVGIAKYNDYYNVIIGLDGGDKAYIFRYSSSNGSWNQHTVLISNDVEYDDIFGNSVAIYDKFAIVGAPYDDDLGTKSGSAYIFKYEESNDSWNQFTKLTASDGTNTDQFGWSVAIYNDTTIIGAAKHDHNEISNSGGAYIFKYVYNETNESWIEIAKLTASDADSGDRFGYQVDIYGDLVIVASLDEGGYVFEYNYINDTWDEIVKIVPPNVGATCVSINGNFVAIGSNSDDMYLGNIDDLKNPPVKVKVNYNYETSLQIVGIDINNTDYFSDSINECNTNDIFPNIVSYPLPINGCYSITFYDCDDSVVNDRTDNHGGYEIEVYNILAGLGGYYFDSETRIICTNDIYNHISFCITPQFCSNNQKLWTHDESDTKMTSYQSMVNSTLTFNQNTTNDIYMTCSGDYSCYNDIFKVCCVFCYFF